MSKFAALNNAPVADELERSSAGKKDVMFSTRITPEQADYIKNASFHLNMTRQELVSAALELFRKENPLK